MRNTITTSFHPLPLICYNSVHPVPLLWVRYASSFTLCRTKACAIYFHVQCTYLYKLELHFQENKITNKCKNNGSLIDHKHLQLNEDLKNLGVIIGLINIHLFHLLLILLRSYLSSPYPRPAFPFHSIDMCWHLGLPYRKTTSNNLMKQPRQTPWASS